MKELQEQLEKLKQPGTGELETGDKEPGAGEHTPPRSLTPTPGESPKKEPPKKKAKKPKKTTKSKKSQQQPAEPDLPTMES